MLESTGEVVGSVYVSEIALAYALFLERGDQLLHHTVAPDGGEVQEYRDRQLLARRSKVLLAKLYRCIKTQIKPCQLAVDYLVIISIICCILLVPQIILSSTIYALL